MSEGYETAATVLVVWTLCKSLMTQYALHAYAPSNVCSERVFFAASCFSDCGAKGPEKPNKAILDVQQSLDLRKTFKAALGDSKPDEHEEMPSVDAPWYWDWQKRNNGYTDPFPGT